MASKFKKLWPEDIYMAIRMNILLAMLGGILFFASDAVIGHLLPYAISKGLSTVVLVYALASALILKRKAVEGYYK